MTQGQGDKQNYFDRLFAYYAQLDEIYGSYAKSHGEKYLSLWVLEEIGDSPEGLSQKEIADKLFAPKQTISSVVAGLVERGMVKTVPSRHDGRSKIQLLTPKGQKLFTEIRQDYAHAEELIAKKLGAERIEQMFESFAVVNEALAHAFEGKPIAKDYASSDGPAKKAGEIRG
ncbi:MAG: MarR family winged helix-turn-helix transcriptional regulator [Coriobacteriia bacterium]|nr:MarR family winged helix-turn-helix transcriptional regulator [Coriobacteriia bacterium]